MSDSFDFHGLPFAWLIATVIIAAAFGGIAYIIASRRVKQPIVVFLARFGIVFFSLFFLEEAVLTLWPSFHATLQNLTATIVSGILTFAGAGHSVSGSSIVMQSPSLSFDITVACLGGQLFWTYIALIVAETTASRKQRLAGILIGIVILIAFNFFRIILSIYLGWRTGFRVHDYFYFFNMVFVLLVWVGWLRTLKPRGKSPAKARL